MKTITSFLSPSGWGGLKKAPPLTIFLAIFVMVMAVVFILPNAERVREARLHYFEWAVFISIGAVVFSRFSRPIGAMILYVGAAMGVLGIARENMVLCAFMSIFFIGLVCAYREHRVRLSESVYNSICVFSMLCFTWQIMQVFGMYIIIVPMQGYESSYPGLMANTNETAALYAMSLPAFFRRKWAWASVVIAAGLVMAKGLGGVIASAVITILLIIRSGMIPLRKVLYCLAVISFVMLFFIFVKEGVRFGGPGEGRTYFHEAATGENNRGRLWVETIRIAMFKPLLGWGIGQYKYAFPLLTCPKSLPPEDIRMLLGGVNDKEALNEAGLAMLESGHTDTFTVPSIEAHNEYLETLFNFGIVGLIILLAGLLMILVQSYRLSDQIPLYGVLASCLCAFVYFNWHIIPTAVITVTYLAVATATDEKECSA